MSQSLSLLLSDICLANETSGLENQSPNTLRNYDDSQLHANSDDALRDRLMCGLRSDSARRRLLADADGEIHVLLYAREVLTLGLFYMEFHDAIREGDGERIIRCWRYLLLLFNVSHCTNYSVEGCWRHNTTSHLVNGCRSN